jgi:hypothetical protein
MTILGQLSKFGVGLIFGLKRLVTRTPPLSTLFTAAAHMRSGQTFEEHDHGYQG